MFHKATKQKARLRMALCGPAGAGKTYSSLAIAKGLHDRVAVIDTEHGSASKYCDEFDFDACELTDFSPAGYTAAIEAAGKAGYGVLVIDSLTHAWDGPGGALEMVDDAAKRNKSGNSYTAWKDVTPVFRRLIETIIACPCHVIVTMRSKTEYVLERNDKGKEVPRRVGMAPVMRQGIEYEFDVVGELDTDHTLIVSKSRCKLLADAVVRNPGADVAELLARWLSTGVDHHHTWPSDREKYLAALAGLEIDEAEACAFVVARGKRPPAEQDQETRTTMLRFLRSERGRAEFGAWAAAQRGETFVPDDIPL